MELLASEVRLTLQNVTVAAVRLAPAPEAGANAEERRKIEVARVLVQDGGGQFYSLHVTRETVGQKALKKGAVVCTYTGRMWTEVSYAKDGTVFVLIHANALIVTEARSPIKEPAVTPEEVAETAVDIARRMQIEAREAAARQLDQALAQARIHAETAERAANTATAARGQAQAEAVRIATEQAAGAALVIGQLEGMAGLHPHDSATARKNAGRRNKKLADAIEAK